MSAPSIVDVSSLVENVSFQVLARLPQAFSDATDDC
jgi:hypothetical protein